MSAKLRTGFLQCCALLFNTEAFPMNNKTEKIKQLRQYLLNQIAGLSTEQLNKRPEGFNNSIIWNIGHLVLAQQNICYRRSGLVNYLQEPWLALFAPGTKADSFIDEQLIETIKGHFISAIDRFEKDLLVLDFSTYTPSEFVKATYGIELKNIEDALEFLFYHEGYHTGYVLSIMKLV